MESILAEINKYNESNQLSKKKEKRKLTTTVSVSVTVGDNIPIPIPIQISSDINALPNVDLVSYKYNFVTDYNDHFATPQCAYGDIYNALSELAESLHKNVHELIIYDPYYCDGAMKTILKNMGK